ncbi:MAG: PPOX class F420-dependent oxidoreductase [Cellulomonas sp.]|uniref:PPOX class F420-dependent oxidoreductase n=1 Tax=Cellulomonas sp. 73-92 TaxID=1895740 RepID=UPI0009262E88|nr:PPOX class F420-dependent oxidoreductase [Cellulomonas sp. 73-92]MBN9375384.1 PPOX class F420-dependent oxidoreductase [Cellulomonas sp.]OJV78897.1 MAG: pyridoxamine 5'-phosphate oxidase [Cellulomonas sp. 73-92]
MPDVDDRLTDAHVAYLATQMLGRLATVDRDGRPQNNPVGFRYNAQLGTIDIDGLDMCRSRKFRNLATNPNVALVVDDIVTVRPWRVRCVEIRGTAEALVDQPPSRHGASGEVIRIHPTRVISFGLDVGGE